MMIVNIQCFGQLRSITKEAIVGIEVQEKASINDAINAFVLKYGEEMEKLLIKEGKIRTFYSIQVNRKNVENEEFDNFSLSDGQTISIIPFVAGG